MCLARRGLHAGIAGSTNKVSECQTCNLLSGASLVTSEKVNHLLSDASLVTSEKVNHILSDASLVTNEKVNHIRYNTNYTNCRKEKSCRHVQSC
jgi:hypothetical protein